MIEKERCFELFHPSTEKVVLDAFIKETIEFHQQEILLEKGQDLKKLILTKNLFLLKEIFFLFEQTSETLTYFKKTVCDIIQNSITLIISCQNQCFDEQSIIQIIQSAIEFHENLYIVFQQCFQSNIFTIVRKHQRPYSGPNNSQENLRLNANSPLRVQKKDLQLQQKEQRENNIKFNQMLKFSFEKLFNSNPNFCYFLNKYIDFCFLSGFKNKLESEIEQEINQIIKIFLYIENKDEFLHIFKQFLSKRLICNNSNHDMEQYLISKLKIECGCQYTSGVTSMFSDIQFSKNLMNEYKQRINKQLQQNLKMNNIQGAQKIQSQPDLNVKILKKGNWSLIQSSLVFIPLELQQMIQQFEYFYSTKHQGRQLEWLFQYGELDLKVNFANQKKEFQISTYQYIILNQFQKQNQISFGELQKITKIESSHFFRNIKPLIDFKLLLLQKSSNKQDRIDQRDVITFNEQLQSNNYKIKIPLLKIKNENQKFEVLQDQQVKKLNVERKQILEACIVRIMKARRQLEHQLLIDEVIKNLKAINQFSPQLNMIKEAIESLMSRDYIKRSEQNSNIYLYII